MTQNEAFEKVKELWPNTTVTVHHDFWHYDRGDKPGRDEIEYLVCVFHGNKPVQHTGTSLEECIQAVQKQMTDLANEEALEKAVPK